MLDGTKLEPDFPWDLLASATDNLSGSDLKELCRNAAMVPVREYLRDHVGQESVMAKAQAEVGQVLPTYSSHPDALQGFSLRPLRIDDFTAGNDVPHPTNITEDRTRLDDYD